MTRYYTGIGSRQTPVYALNIMWSLAHRLAELNYVLRSGKASGADTAFQLGMQSVPDSRAEIYIPWNKFVSDNPEIRDMYDINEGNNYRAREIAMSIHPAWDKCSQGAQKLHTRNVCQILGRDLSTPSDFVLFWAPETNGKVSGGTATAVKLAREYGIPTVNLFFSDWKEKIVKHVKKD